MSRDVDVFPQYTVYLAAKTRVLDGFSDISMDMIKGKVWGDTVTDFPTIDIFTHCYDLSSTVGTRNDVRLLAVDRQGRT